MKFSYKAKKGLENIIEGTIEARSQEEALNKLTQQGLFPFFVEPDGAGFVGESSAAAKSKRRLKNKKITNTDTLVFTKKMTTMVRSQVELLTALRIIHEQTEHSRFKEVVFQLYTETKQGKTFSESLAKFPLVFSTLYVNMVKAGEATGALDKSLEQISEFLKRQENLKNKITMALAYPALLLFVGIASILVLINFVVPRLRPMFERAGQDLPLITKFIFKMSEFSHLTMGSLIAAVIIIPLFLKTSQGQRSALKIKDVMFKILPVFRSLQYNQELASFSRSLCLLLQSGVSLLHSLEIVIPLIQRKKLRKALETSYSQVAQGERFAKSIAVFSVLPNFFVKMLLIGEESGRMAEVLDELSYSYIDQVERDISIISSLIEPVLILFLGLILGGIVLAILLPTFQITQVMP